MRKGLLATILVALVGAGAAWGQDGPMVLCPNASPQVSQSCVWGNAEYLLWWVRGNPLTAPLVTTSSDPLATSATGYNVSAGLGVPGTSVLLGGPINYSALSGARFTLGGWLDNDATIGIEGRGFFMGQSTASRTYRGDAAGNPILAVPLNNTAGDNPVTGIGGGENAFAASFPGGLVFGSITVSSQLRLWGTEANGVFNVVRDECRSVDLLLGFRYADLRENLSVNTQTSNDPINNPGGLTFLNAAVPGTITTSDSFQVRNQFYGGQVGVRATQAFGDFFVTGSAKVALGSTHQVSEISGSSSYFAPGGGVMTAPGGILALSSNSGTQTRNAFSVIPEVEAKLGYNFTSRMSGFVGYNFMYWSNVARAGQQFDHNVDVRQIPSLPGYDPTVRTTPSAQINSSGFWAQGVTFGLLFKF